jgi:formylglycine-generating enzyme required for sulfatase activity
VPKAARVNAALAALLLAGAGCRGKSGDTAAPGAPAASSGAAPSAVAEVTAPLAGERIDVPGGAFKAGSVPGEPGRHPELESRLATVELGPYRMDRLPYPNDPAASPRVNVTRDEAERLCAEHGTRLCTELEWERACKGPESRKYATGDAWDPRCEKNPRACASPFDVLGLGAMREWTASDVVPDGDGARKAAVRGAAPGAPGTQHRCAARSAEKPDAAGEDIGFRCCKGARNAALVDEPHAGQTFVQATITPARVAELLKASPKTERLAKDVRFFREPDGADTVVSRGPGDRKGFFFTVAPLVWNPVAGAEFLVVTGRSGETTSFVAVFHVLGKNEYLLASSFIMENEVGPVALAYNGYIRPRLHFSTCWGCPGETGKILYRDPDAVAIVQP